MIIETSSNQFFQVLETGDASLAHVWSGVEVKRVKGAFVPKKNARQVLVRKEASRMVEA
jgi:hypothetical protein